jgi:hypothetical protein
VKPYDILKVKFASYFLTDYSVCRLVGPRETSSRDAWPVTEETTDDLNVTVEHD